MRGRMMKRCEVTGAHGSAPLCTWDWGRCECSFWWGLSMRRAPTTFPCSFVPQNHRSMEKESGLLHFAQKTLDLCAGLRTFAHMVAKSVESRFAPA